DTSDIGRVDEYERRRRINQGYFDLPAINIDPVACRTGRQQLAGNGAGAISEIEPDCRARVGHTGDCAIALAARLAHPYRNPRRHNLLGICGVDTYHCLGFNCGYEPATNGKRAHSSEHVAAISARG